MSNASDLADIATLLEVNEEISRDTERPKIKRLNPLDEVEVELTMFEADNLIEQYFERYRDRFINPDYFEALREAHRSNYREHIRNRVEWAKSLIKGTGMESDFKRTMQEQMADDGLEVTKDSPLELRHISGAVITGEAAKEIIERYKRGLRYGKQ